MLYLSHVPRPPLDQFVEYLWLLSAAPAHSREHIMPSGTLELVINLHDDEFRIYDRERAGRCDRFPGMVVSGTYGRFFMIDTAEHALTMGVHFRPGGAFPFLPMPANELADEHVDVQTLWGRRAEELRERLIAAVNPAQRFRLLENALLAHACRPLRGRPAVRLALQALGCEGVSVGDVIDRIGMSHRRFIDVFRAEVGMTPKLFCRVRRFQRLIAAVHAGPATDWTRLALRSGYFDQSHLIRDFSTFSGVTPEDYRRRPRDDVKENHVALI